jgi:DNA-binding response OmpR family regulator
VNEENSAFRTPHSAVTRVLLVEDGRSRHAEYRRSLEVAGFEVYSAYDGTEVAGIVEAARPAIIVSDTDLPTVDGDEAVRPLFEAGQLDGVLIIGMSSASEYERHWDGLAHQFRHKREFDDLGETVSAIYGKFKT